MNVAVLTFPGSNCDYDCYKAVKLVGGQPTFRWHRDSDLSGADVVIVPGGFSYGDYLRAGAIARFSPIMESVQEFAENGGPVLGICNGFKILCEAGLLPGALVRNQTLRFSSRDVHIRVEDNATRFTSNYEVGQVLRVPIAHAEGCYVADPELVAALEKNGQVVFRYTDPEDYTADAVSPANPNGSVHDIAGIRNENGNVVGMMPHPERAVSELLGSMDGLGVFTALVGAMSSVGSDSVASPTHT